MVKKTHLVVLGMTLLLGTSIVGASAFTSASVQRDAAIDVVSDDVGIVGLGPGNSAIVALQGDKLTIDTAIGSASGVNQDATLTVGNSSSPSTDYAFNVTNNAGTSKDVDFDYSITGTDTDTTSDDVRFTVYRNSSAVGSFTEEDSGLTVSSVGSGSTLYVVMTIDTTNNPVSDDLSGTVSISAS